MVYQSRNLKVEVTHQRINDWVEIFMHLIYAAKICGRMLI